MEGRLVAWCYSTVKVRKKSAYQITISDVSPNILASKTSAMLLSGNINQDPSQNSMPHFQSIHPFRLLRKLPRISACSLYHLTSVFFRPITTSPRSSPSTPWPNSCHSQSPSIRRRLHQIKPIKQQARHPSLPRLPSNRKRQHHPLSLCPSIHKRNSMFRIPRAPLCSNLTSVCALACRDCSQILATDCDGDRGGDYVDAVGESALVACEEVGCVGDKVGGECLGDLELGGGGGVAGCDGSMGMVSGWDVDFVWGGGLEAALGSAWCKEGKNGRLTQHYTPPTHARYQYRHRSRRSPQ